MISTALDNIAVPPAAKLLGWRLIDAKPKEGWIKVGFDGKAEFCNPAGFVQGGLLSAMLDDTMGPAAFIMTEGKLYTTTISLTVNFLAPAKPGPITAEAKVTQLGKTIAFVEGRLTAEDGTLLATASVSARLIEAAKAIR
jgi:uncharacterized protein (TIGR00369 family)